MAVFNDAIDLREKGYATMEKTTIVPFELPSEFSSDPLTEVIQAGARELLRTVVQAEVSAFIAEHVLGRLQGAKRGIFAVGEVCVAALADAAGADRQLIPCKAGDDNQDPSHGVFPVR